MHSLKKKKLGKSGKTGEKMGGEMKKMKKTETKLGYKTSPFP